MCVTVCGRFCPDEGAVAGYATDSGNSRKWGVQIAGMIFQTGSSLIITFTFQIQLYIMY